MRISEIVRDSTYYQRCSSYAPYLFAILSITSLGVFFAGINEAVHQAVACSAFGVFATLNVGFIISQLTARPQHIEERRIPSLPLFAEPKPPTPISLQDSYVFIPEEEPKQSLLHLILMARKNAGEAL